MRDYFDQTTLFQHPKHFLEDGAARVHAILADFFFFTHMPSRPPPGAGRPHKSALGVIFYACKQPLHTKKVVSRLEACLNYGKA